MKIFYFRLRSHGTIGKQNVHSGCMALWIAIAQTYVDAICAQAAWTYMIAIALRLHGPIQLHSGCTDLYDCHFVLRSHGPIFHTANLYRGLNMKLNE